VPLILWEHTMKHKGPIITLLAGLVVAGVLYGLNVNVSHDAAKTAAARNAAANATTGITPSTSPSAAAPPSLAPSLAPSKPPEGKNTYAGATDGGQAGLALAMNGGKAIAYVCDGKAAESWMSGTAEGGKITLRSAKGTGTLTGTYANGVAVGTVTAGTKTWRFTIHIAKPPSGLYRSAAKVRNRLDASWAVIPSGDGVKQFGVRWINGVATPAPELDTTTNTAMVDGTPVQVDPTEVP
jgi:hypothetical protein